MAAQKREKSRPEYTPIERSPGAFVVTIECIFNRQVTEDDDYISRAIEELQSVGAARIVASMAVVETFDDAADILSRRAIRL